MPTVEEALDKLTPEHLVQAMAFVECLLEKQEERHRPGMSCDWVGGLEHMQDEFTAVELQHKANDWRCGDAVVD